MGILGRSKAWDLTVRNSIEQHIPRRQWMLTALATDFLAWSVGHDAHRAVRTPIHRFFSKPGLARLEGRIVERVQKLAARLEGFSNTGMVVNLNNVFRSHVSGKFEGLERSGIIPR